jgi:hypothetical protein
MKKIIDTDIQAPGLADQKIQAEAGKAQSEAALTVIDEMNRAPQFEAIPINVTDSNASLAMKLDSKTYPGQAFRKTPTKIVQGFEPASKDPNING